MHAAHFLCYNLKNIIKNPMRKIIVSEFVSLDGVIEGPGAMDSFQFAGWTMPYGNEEIMKFKYDELFAADALLLGRITYDGFAAAWPKITGAGDFGERMNSIPKFVVSKTADKLGWQNSTLIARDAGRQNDDNGQDGIAQAITKLKDQPGKDILVFGSSQLIETLMRTGLIDEYRLLVYPVVLGAGKKLFKDGTNAKLKFIEMQSFSTGVVLLRYTAEK